jgi:TatD DNase family protein
MIIDSHCHVDQFPNPEGLVETCERLGLRTIAVTNLPSHYEMALPHLRSKRCVTAALGMHPMCAKQAMDERFDFRRLAIQADYIGEIGLDFSRHGKSTAQEQEEVFEFVLQAISDRPRFVTIHSRGAEKAVLDSLRRHGIQGAVFHWFSGTDSAHAEVVAAGHFLSINPAMLKTAKGRRHLEATPLDRLLAESDGPFARFEGKVVSPVEITFVYREIARFHGISPSQAEECLESNFRRANGAVGAELQSNVSVKSSS